MTIIITIFTGLAALIHTQVKYEATRFNRDLTRGR